MQLALLLTILAIPVGSIVFLVVVECRDRAELRRRAQLDVQRWRLGPQPDADRGVAGRLTQVQMIVGAGAQAQTLELEDDDERTTQ